MGNFNISTARIRSILSEMTLEFNTGPQNDANRSIVDCVEMENNRFELLRLLGEGTYGKVFSAFVRGTNFKTAIKVTDKISEDIKNELGILRDLASHPNLPSFFGIFMTPHSELFLAMELCEGGSAASLCRALHAEGNILSDAHLSYVLYETACGIKYLHDHNFIHRDIKGDNIMFTDMAHIKIIDFGITVNIDSPSFKGNLMAVGTPQYMAPEVITCEQSQQAYDTRCDVWSIGITAIELADGQPPLSKLNPSSVLFNVPRSPSPTLTDPRMRTHSFNDFIKRCLVHNFTERPFIGNLLQHPFFQTLNNDATSIRNNLKYEIIRQNVLNIRKCKRK